MKFILLIIVTMSQQNDGRTPVAVDHMTFNTQAACEQYRATLGKAPKRDGGGLMGAVNALNGVINAPTIDARPCEAVNDSPATEG